MKKIGVLVMSYGTPESLDGIEAYYTHIRHGRPPSAEQLEDLRSRYEAIVGGVFPLREHTDNQVKGLQEALNRLYPDNEFVCYQGLKHVAPFIEDGVQQMARDGIKEAVGVVLAPHFSTMSVGSYNKRAKETAEEAGISMTCVESYHLHPKLLEALEKRIQAALQKFPADKRDQVKVLFSAHSLPEKILEIGDPYPKQLMETSEELAKRCGITNWQFAWQSAGQTGTPWLGPDIQDVIRTVHEEEGVQQILVCPIGFVSDHLEVLYDIDIECKQVASEIGVQLERTESLNTDPLYMETLASVVAAQLERV
ncbi:ferrochelatase [Paenibacillus turpanensis]|uniref:ferrochelatase n=1 Tax=Paenibacillus turpanensis TaxID=2689078 RepID=UPI00140D50E8|nr:ferrochelatase [Paenibacillus turpanensis]